MTIEQKHPLTFVPYATFEARVISDSSPSSVAATHRDLNFSVRTNSVQHNEFVASVINLSEDYTLSSIPTGSIDTTEFPLLKRADGFASWARLRVDNGKAIQAGKPLDFRTSGAAIPYNDGPVTPVGGTYFDYSFDRVMTVLGDLPDNRFLANTWPTSRVNDSVLPQQVLTGIPVRQGVGTETYISGFHPFAITPRHCICVGHYGGNVVGNVLKFLDVENNIISRTIVRQINMTQADDTRLDFMIVLLNEDLPEEITPIHVMGDWFCRKATGETTATFCRQGVGICFWSNQGHLSPMLRIAYVDTIKTRDFLNYALNVLQDRFYYDSIVLPGYEVQAISPSYTDWNLVEMPELNYDFSGGQFYHFANPGDSGSPILMPVGGDGWAVTSTIEGTAMSALGYNTFIALIDSRHGISTGYTVTVAPDPTL